VVVLRRCFLGPFCGAASAHGPAARVARVREGVAVRERVRPEWTLVDAERGQTRRELGRLAARPRGADQRDAGSGSGSEL